MNKNFDTIRSDGRLLYEHYRGSFAQGTFIEGVSDKDTSGVYLCTKEELLGIKGYVPQVSDKKHDNTWFEIGEFVRLLMKSNPTILEMLFIPKDKVIGEVHPIMQLLIDNRELFISKQCFNPFFGYAKSQIEKARGLNKKINNPIKELLTPFDFIYTFKGQGSVKIKEWLSAHGLKQEFCGLVNIPNMHDIYGLYYDWGNHVANVPYWRESRLFIETVREYFNLEWEREVMNKLELTPPIGYRGIMNQAESSFKPRLSSIENKDIKPLCFISYNEDGFKSHCKLWKEQQEWIEKRNPQRYESNLEKSYDSKNMAHSFRMIHMAKEIACGKGVIVDRSNIDRDFLLDVRNHEFEYDELIKLLNEEKEEMNALMKESTIRETIDVDFVNDLMIKIRKEQLGL